MNLKIPSLKIGNLEARVPIIQGGMGVGISMSGLASAVANEGGIGVIAGSAIGMLEPDFNMDFKQANERVLRREIRRAKQQTRGILGVNLLVALNDYFDLLKVAVEERIDIVFLGAGLALKMPDTLIPTKTNNVTTKVAPIVSSGRAARLIFQYWAKHYNHVPDAVVVEGPMAGGHLGFKKENIFNPEFRLEKIVPEVVSVVADFEKSMNKDIPVIAAGGVYTGDDINKFLKMGAKGVQMATRFVATDECDASPEFKQSYVNCSKEDLVIIDSPVGLPGRAIRNKFLEDVSAGKKKPFKCNWVCLKTCDIKKSLYCICGALTSAKRGKFEHGFAFAGANAYRVDRIMPVKELMSSLMAEYKVAAYPKLLIKY